MPLNTRSLNSSRQGTRGGEKRLAPDANHLPWQILWLFVLGIPVSCVAWTVTHEDVFREPRNYCKQCSRSCRWIWQRKFFYLFTCEYCFSHYIAIVFIALTGFRLLLDNWFGYVIGFFALVWVANLYMSFYGQLRVAIRSEQAQADARQRDVAIKEREIERLGDDANHPKNK